MYDIDPTYRSYSAYGGVVYLALLIVLASGLIPVKAAEGMDNDPNITWDEKYHAVSFVWLGQKGAYPEDMAKGEFPESGKEPKIEIKKEWPVVVIRARWTISTKDWPAKYRSQALDLILMYACDAELYHIIFPETIKTSHFIYPPEYLKEAKDPHAHDLAGVLRGKEVAYEITAKTGTHLPDYTIKSKMRLGVSKDKKTVFYCDRPEYISKYLTQRLMFFAVRDAGDSLQFEVRAIFLCKPRRLFKGTTLDNIEKDTHYMIEQFYAKLEHASTEKQIEAFLDRIKIKKLPVEGLKDKVSSLISGQKHTVNPMRIGKTVKDTS